MRLALLIAVLGAVFDYQTPFLDGLAQNPSSHLDSSQYGGLSTVLSQPLDNASWTPGTWSSTLPTPSLVWYNSDQTGGGGVSWLGSVTGSIPNMTSPFCAAGSCWTAGTFDGANDYIDSTNDIGDIGSAAFTVAVLFRPGVAVGGTVRTMLNKKAAGGIDGGYFLYVDASDRCAFSAGNGSAAGTYLSAATVAAGAWQVCSASFVPGGNTTVYNNGTAGGPGGSIATPIDYAGALSVGAMYNSHSNKMTGEIAAAFIWQGTAFSTAQHVALVQRLTKVQPAAGQTPVFDRPTVGMGLDVAGQWQAFGPGIPTLTANGYGSFGAVVTYWLNWLDASAWTDSGTPAITTNTDSGPFSAYNGGPEADTIGDNDAGAWEGKSVLDGTTLGVRAMQCWLKAGTVGSYRIGITTDGTGSTTWVGTDLDATWKRKTGTATMGGTPTYIQAFVHVGNTAAVTGDIKVAGCQLERAAFAGRPCPTGGTSATCNADDLSATITPTAWPTKRGRFTFTFTPDAGQGAVGMYFISTRGGAGASGWSFALQNNLFLQYYSKSTAGGGSSVMSTGTESLTAGTPYTYVVNWTPDGTVTVTRNGASVAMTGTATDLADSMSTTVDLCRYSSNGYEPNGSCAGMRVQK